MAQARAEIMAKEAAAAEVASAAEVARANTSAAAEALSKREAALQEGEASVARAKAELSQREASMAEREAGLTVRENAVAQSVTALEVRERAAVAAEASLQQRQHQLAEAAAAATAPLVMAAGCGGQEAGAAAASQALYDGVGRIHGDEASGPGVGEGKSEVGDGPRSTDASAARDAKPSTAKLGVAEAQQELHRSKVC